MDIEFKDAIHHTTTTVFPFWQRVKHLLGVPIVIESKIACEHEVGFTKTEARGLSPRIFKRSRHSSTEMGGYTDDPRAVLNGQLARVKWWKLGKRKKKELVKMIDSPDTENMELARTIIESKS